jgi:hypothetical protein
MLFKESKRYFLGQPGGAPPRLITAPRAGGERGAGTIAGMATEGCPHQPRRLSQAPGQQPLVRPQPGGRGWHG